MNPRIECSILSCLGPDDRHLRSRAVRDPHLRAVQHKAAVGLLAGRRDHAAGIRTIVRLREPEAPHDRARRHPGQIPLLLLVAPEREDRVHDERPLDGCERAHAGVAAFELLHDESIGDVAQARAPVLLRQIGAKQSELRHRRHDLTRKTAVHVALADHGQHALIDEPAHALANGALLFGQHAVDVEEVSCHGGEV